jgi:hypothetical protein
MILGNQRRPTMGDDENPDRRRTQDRRSGADTRSEAEKLVSGERRLQIDRRSSTTQRAEQPSNEQLALFARRLKRAMTDEKGRHFFGVAAGEYDFKFYPDVLRATEWIESLVAVNPTQPKDPGKISSRKPVP